MIHIGSSGYSYDYWGSHPKAKEIINFYPDRNKSKRLSHYAQTLKSVEINCTRYRKLTVRMCQKWLKQVPKNFTFAIKASTYITHNKKLNDFQEWWDNFYPCVKTLGNQLSSILFQFPPAFKYTKQNLIKLHNMKRIIPDDIHVALEFRDNKWYTAETSFKSLFTGAWTQVILHVPEVRGYSMNFGDLAGGWHVGVTNDKFIYIRCHGTWQYSSGTYGPEGLLTLMEHITVNKENTICVYFNNVDTWTMLPEFNREYHYNDKLILGKQMIPSAIFDAKLLGEFLSC